MMNTELVKVSVIMPVYNAEDYLRPAIDSVLDSTLREIELICVDDGSTDKSLDIIKEYQKNDARVRIITEKVLTIRLAVSKYAKIPKKIAVTTTVNPKRSTISFPFR